MALGGDGGEGLAQDSPRPSQESGRHSAKCSYKLPSWTGLSCLFLPFFLCRSRACDGGSGDSTALGCRTPAVCLSICWSVGLCDLCSLSLSPYPRESVESKFFLYKLLARTPGLGTSKGQREPCELRDLVTCGMTLFYSDFLPD